MNGYVRGFSCKPTSMFELRVRLARSETGLSPLVFFLLTVLRQCFFCGSFVLFMYRVCHAFTSIYFALWSPVGKGLISWLLFVMFIVILLLSHLVSWVRCGT